jgi:hypothetical protein
MFELKIIIILLKEELSFFYYCTGRTGQKIQELDGEQGF